MSKRGGRLSILEFITFVIFITFCLVFYPNTLWIQSSVEEDYKRIKLGKATILFCWIWADRYQDDGVYIPLFVQGLIGYTFAVIYTICGIIAYSVNYIYMINNLFLL